MNLQEKAVKIFALLACIVLIIALGGRIAGI